MAANSVHRGTVVRNDSSGVWVHVIHANGDDAGDMPGPALVVPGTIVTVGAPVIVSFEQNVRYYPVILGNYGPTYLQPGTLLNAVKYEPNPNVMYDLTSSPAAVNSTNLTISFMVPVSGRVLAKAAIYGYAQPPLSSGSEVYFLLGYVTHGTSSLVSTVQVFMDNRELGITVSGGGASGSITTGPFLGGLCNYSVLVTGLTPGETLQWDLAGYYTGSPLQATLQAGNNAASDTAGQALLSIYAA